MRQKGGVLIKKKKKKKKKKRKEKSSEASEILSKDLLNRINISNQSERFTEERQNTSQKRSIDRHPGAALYETSKKVGLVDYSNIRNPTPLKTE